MRLSPQQVSDIVRLTHEHVHPQAKVWLFGSRVDDNARGGDIDIYIETPAIDDPGLAKIHLRLAFEDAWGECKVDLVLHQQTNPEQPIHVLARTEGIRLV